jgi:chromosome segregation ATPase
MTLTVAEIIIEVRREAERKHGVPDEMAQNWPRFSLAKVVPLCDEIDRLTAERDGLRTDLAAARAQTDAIADEWQRENDKLNACRAERDALAGQLAKVRQAYQVYRDSGAGIAGVTFFTFEEWLDYISDSENVPTW